MATQKIVNSKPQAQTQAPQVRDKPTATAQIGDYIRVPFAPVMQVVERDILQDGQVWLLVKPVSASYTEEWVLEPETPTFEQRQPEPRPQNESVGEAGDEAPSSVQPTPKALTEFETGRCHGQADAAERQHPIYTKPESEYAIGYLEGYHGNSTQQQPAPTQPVEWSVVYDPRWQCYQAWVKDRCIDHASTYQEAERLAQRYIALDKTIKRQNAAVMKAYAG